MIYVHLDIENRDSLTNKVVSSKIYSKRQTLPSSRNILKKISEKLKNRN